jgi:hypothetical protein
MKLLPVLILLASLATVRADEALSTVRFSNNDRLEGTLRSLSPERLVWDSPVLEKPVPFFLSQVLDLSLNAVPPDSDARHEATVTLTNGDILRGQLASVSDATVELDTTYAGRLALNRLMISNIVIDERPELIYRGPTGPEGWKHSGTAWSYQNNSLRSAGNGGIARAVDLPEECSISFDAEWRNAFGLKLAFFSDDASAERPDTGYEISFQKRFVYLRSSKTQMSIGNSSNATTLQENEKARIEIRASLKSGKICVFIDGEIIDVWTDPDFAKVGKGRAIHFISQNEFPVRLSRIEVAEWDGMVDKTPEPQVPGFRQFGREDREEEPEPEKKLAADRMELRNGDSITGEVLSISGGRIQVKTPFREVRLPLEALRTVALKPVSLERCKRENGDVRGWLPDGSSIVFRLESVGEGTLQGTSQNFGSATFRMDAFSRIEFNIYEPALEDIRASQDW